MTTEAYHLEELRIARDASDPRRTVPTVRPHHRRILDVGCGAGQTLIACVPGGDDAPFAVGVDLDRDALALGRRLDGGLAFANSLGERLPFADASFDLVFSRVALPYMPVGVALREMARVLAPGGDLWLTLHPLDKTLAELRGDLRARRAKALLHRAYVIANGLSLDLLGREWPTPWRRDRYESFQTERAIRRALAAAGFVDVRTERGAAFVVTARRR